MGQGSFLLLPLGDRETALVRIKGKYYDGLTI